MIYGLTGLQRSGKDSAAHTFQGLGYPTYALADKVKDTVDDLFCWNSREMPRYEKCFTAPVSDLDLQVMEYSLGLVGFAEKAEEELRKFKHSQIEDDNFGPPSIIYSITPREAWQTIGTDIGRALDSEIWIKQMPSFTDCVWTDIRFNNEAKAIINRGGKIIEITRDTGINDDHESEQGVSDHLIHRSIENEGSLIDLHNQILDLILGETT